LGVAKATLTTGSDPTNRTITLTATAGTVSSNTALNVVGTTLSVAGPASLVLGNTGTYSVTLLDSSGKAIAGKTLGITSTKANQLSAATLTTDPQGKANVVLTASNPGTDTLTATALGLTAQQSIAVSGQNFQFTAPAANAKIVVGPSGSTPVTINWTVNGLPVADGTSINFAATRGTLSTTNATTLNGQATVSISSNNSGPAVISATAAGVSAQLNVSFVANKPDTIAVQASPATIATQAQSTITATVRDATGNLVEGQQVDFAISAGGGTLSLASALTNSQGQAQTVYTAGSTPSGSNGVTIVASYPTNALGYAPTTSSISAKLTVGGQAVFLSLGTGNKISEDTNQTKFIQPWVVQAIDSAGNAVAGVSITLTVHSTRYFKGIWKVLDTDTTKWSQLITVGGTCLNEDVNHNGQYIKSADTNNNGTLEPGDIALSAPGSVTTGVDGSASFTVNYPEDHAEWVEVKLTASTIVAGTESSTSQIYVLPILGKYPSDTSANPPGVVSPYGINICTIAN
jgi:hypothetical protein